MTWDYRGERWWPLLTSILDISLKCAYLTAKVQEYVSACLELAGPCILQQTHVEVNKSKTSSDIAIHVETAWNCTRFDNVTYMYITDWIIYMD